MYGTEKQTVVVRAFEFICKSCRGVVGLYGMISECLVDSREIASAWVRGEIIGLRREAKVKAAGEAFMAARNEASAKSKLRAVPEAKAEAQMK